MVGYTILGLPVLKDLQYDFLQLLLPEVLSNKKINLNLKNKIGINVYRNNLLGTLSNTLSEIFPICRKLIGDTSFAAITKQYILNTPSNVYSLNFYGENFPDYLKNYAKKYNIEYLVSVAMLEWSLNISQNGQNSFNSCQSQLANVSETDFPKVVFKLIPNSKLLQLDYPADKIWQYNQNNSSGQLLVEKKRVYLFIFTRQSNVYIDRVTKLEYSFLKEISNYLSFEAIFTELESKMSFDDLVASLSKFINLGYIDSLAVN